MPTVVELLRRRAGSQPDTLAFRSVGDHGEPEASVSYRELDRAARAIAATLLARGAAGQPVLLLYPPGLDYVAGFLGCLYAGAIAVPAYPPDPARLPRTLPRLQALAGDCGAAVALTVAGLAELAPAVTADAPELAGLDWLATDTLPLGAAGDWTPPPGASSPASPALLQYTSGSTGTPRGVLLSHANLLHNAGLVHRGFGTSPDTVGVSWLPPYHDMGLIGGILQPLYAGFPVLLMSPLTFLQRPLAWLETISAAGATMSGGPNFAFDLCVRKSTAAQRAALDLSGWRLAFCGAEPVRAATLDRFAAAFAPAGFRPEAFYPCYGLAEATLIVTGGQPPRRTRTGEVGCGRPLGDQALAVVDPATGTPCPPGTEGEIWLAGPSVAQGYWRRPEETAAAFGARLAGDPADRRYLRTGDLGRLDPAGELVVTGRIKDLIIVRGRNLHPPDLEAAVERAVPQLRPGCTAAFPVVRDGAEQVGIAAELAEPPAPPEDYGPVVAAVRQAVAEAAEVPVAAVVLLRRGQVPKTSSGKLQRYACRQASGTGDWAAGAPGVLARWDARGEGGGGTAGATDRPAGGVLGVVAGVLGLPPEQVPAGAPLTGLGLDSLRAIELRAGLRASLGLDVPLSDLLTGATVAELATRQPEPPAAEPPAAEPPAAEPPAAVPPVTGPSGPAELPATDGQRALWLIQRWAPDSTAYHVSRAARIRSVVDPDALERALRAVVDRHPVLRTCLPDRGGVPVQRRFAWTGAALERHQVPGLAEEALRQQVQADADRPFDLERGPLFRAVLYSRDATDHVLLLSLHHTITDFWSLTVLADELLAAYQGRPLAGLIMDFPPRHTGDTPAKLHDQRDGTLAYWREVLAGAPPALALPTTFPRPRLQSLRGASHQFRLSPALLRRVDAVAAGAGVTRFAVLAAGFAAVLSRWTGDEDVVVGAPAAGRGVGDEGQLGYFANPVPLRVRVPEGVTFRELARQAGQVVIGALEHPVPFPRLVEAVRPVRDPGRPPVLQVMLGLQRPPSGRPDLAAFAVADESARVRLAGLEVQPFRLPETGAAFDLGLTLAEVDGGLAGTVTYCADLFDPPAVQRLTGHLTALLAGATTAPDQPLETVPLLDAAERARVLALAEGPVRAYPDHIPLDRLFRQRAAGAPAATAVVAGRHRLTYGELDQRSDRLAARLVTGYGVRRGDRVAVFLPRGPEALVAFWAALKAGGGYLPLPADLPPARLSWMLTDAAPAVVLTCRALADRLPAGGPARICLDQPEPDQPDLDQPDLDQPDLDQPEPDQPRLPAGWDGPGPDDLAYVLYTSGSTGRPKAVMIPHRSAANMTLTVGDGTAVTPASRVLQFASCAYDVHVQDFLVAHLHGAELHLPPEEATVPGQALLDLLGRERITHVTFSPSVLAALPDADLPALGHILCGGEPCPPEVVDRWAPGREFRNAYGPTETTVCVTWLACRPDRRPPPIGAAMANVSVHVLDGRMEPVPVGVPGEIYIGGKGVGWGYLGRPALTAERFVPDPFRPGTGARLYRTGDLARRLPDGTLEFLGRLDDQLKIRGIRVEPGEVAARIRELPGIRDAAVVPGTGPAGGVELVAYLVAADRDGADRRPAAELRGRLRAELPEAWLPAAFVYLDALPLNPSGKLDRRALPPPAPADRGRTGQLAARTELERTIAEVWASVLGQARVGVRDHFFDELGGTSLLVGQVTSELARRLGRDLPVTLLFEHPTVEALARRLDPAGAAPVAPAPEAATPEEQAARRRAALARRARPDPPGP